MATQPRRKLQVYGYLGQDGTPTPFPGFEAASQSFDPGDVLCASSGLLTKCATNPTSIIGISAENASGTTNAQRMYYPAKGLVFAIPVWHDTPASAVTAYSQIGATYNLKLDSDGYWLCDIEHTTATSIQVVGLHPGDTVGDAYGRVLVTFIDSVVQTGTATYGSSIAFATDAAATFRAAGQKIYSSAVNTLDINAGATLNLGAAAVAQAVTVGNKTGASALNLYAGTGNIVMEGVAATTITIGKSDQTGAMKFGESTGAITGSIFTGNGNKTVAMMTGSGTNALTIGSTTTATVIGGKLNYGSGATKNAMTTTITGAGLVTGQAIILSPAVTSDGNCTLALNGGAAKKILCNDASTQLGSGKAVAKAPLLLVYDSTLDSAAGAWVAVAVPAA